MKKSEKLASASRSLTEAIGSLSQKYTATCEELITSVVKGSHAKQNNGELIFKLHSNHHLKLPVSIKSDEQRLRDLQRKLEASRKINRELEDQLKAVYFDIDSIKRRHGQTQTFSNQANLVEQKKSSNGKQPGLLAQESKVPASNKTGGDPQQKPNGQSRNPPLMDTKKIASQVNDLVLRRQIDLDLLSAQVLHVPAELANHLISKPKVWNDCVKIEKKAYKEMSRLLNNEKRMDWLKELSSPPI
jgi:hypothetical protein